MSELPTSTLARGLVPNHAPRTPSRAVPLRRPTLSAPIWILHTQPLPTEGRMRTNAAEKFQGNPCKRNPSHTGQRYRTSGACVDCTREDGAAKRANAKAAKAGSPP